MNTRTLQTEDYRALAELRHQIRRFLHFSEQAARVASLRLAQYQFLLAVKGLPEGRRPTIRVLSERLRLKHHSVVGLVDRLAWRGLVLRRRGEADRREILVASPPGASACWPAFIPDRAKPPGGPRTARTWT